MKIYQQPVFLPFICYLSIIIMKCNLLITNVSGYTNDLICYTITNLLSLILTNLQYS